MKKFRTSQTIKGTGMVCSTGFIEGINGLIQAAKNKARGYRSDKKFITIAYLLGTKLEFHLPT